MWDDIKILVTPATMFTEAIPNWFMFHRSGRVFFKENVKMQLICTRNPVLTSFIPKPSHVCHLQYLQYELFRTASDECTGQEWRMASSFVWLNTILLNSWEDWWFFDFFCLPTGSCFWPKESVKHKINLVWPEHCRIRGCSSLFSTLPQPIFPARNNVITKPHVLD